MQVSRAEGKQNAVFVVFFIFCFIFVPSGAKPVCSLTTEYTIVKNGKVIGCEKCPDCSQGTGRIKQCGSKLENGTDFSCKTCASDTFNYDGVTCKQCHTCENMEILVDCTPKQNRKCGKKCLKEFYFDPELRNCLPCAPCCNNATVREKKCEDDNLPPNMQCQASTEKCLVMKRTPEDTRNSTSSNQNMTESIQVTRHVSNLHPPSPETSGPTKQDTGSTPYWVAVVICLAIICLGMFAVTRKKKQQINNVPSPPMNVGPSKGCRSRFTALSEEEERLVPSCPLSTMDGNLYLYLRGELDIRNPGMANWCEVGFKFGIPKKQLDKLKNEYFGGSPTSGLLGILEARGEDEPTVKDLVNVLLELGRRDIVNNWDWNSNREKTGCGNCADNV